MHQKHEVNRPPLFFVQTGRRVAGGSEDALAPLYWPEISMATNTPLPATSTASNTPPNAVYGDESGFFVMGIQSRNPKESEHRMNRRCFVSGIFCDPPFVLVWYPFCIWILIDDANLLWKYQIWTTRHGGRRSGAWCIPCGRADAGKANHGEGGAMVRQLETHMYWFFHEPEFSFHGIGSKSLAAWNSVWFVCAACFFYLIGWIKSAPTYSYPCWISVALIFIFA